jgi:hypothetical protein
MSKAPKMRCPGCDLPVAYDKVESAQEEDEEGLSCAVEGHKETTHASELPTKVQEQLSNEVCRICISYLDMDTYFILTVI